MHKHVRLNQCYEPARQVTYENAPILLRQFAFGSARQIFFSADGGRFSYENMSLHFRFLTID